MTIQSSPVKIGNFGFNSCNLHLKKGQLPLVPIILEIIWVLIRSISYFRKIGSDRAQMKYQYKKSVSANLPFIHNTYAMKCNSDAYGILFPSWIWDTDSRHPDFSVKILTFALINIDFKGFDLQAIMKVPITSSDYYSFDLFYNVRTISTTHWYVYHSVWIY
jgi:hypothetical protein